VAGSFISNIVTAVGDTGKVGGGVGGGIEMGNKEEHRR